MFVVLRSQLIALSSAVHDPAFFALTSVVRNAWNLATRRAGPRAKDEDAAAINLVRNVELRAQCANGTGWLQGPLSRWTSFRLRPTAVVTPHTPKPPLKCN